MFCDVHSKFRDEVRHMNRQAGIAWLIVVLQAAMFWYMSETVLFPILVVAISSPAVWWRRRWEVSSGYLPWMDLALAGGCALRWNLAPYEPPTMISFLNYPLVHAAGQFFLLAQVARLWARRPDRPLPVYLPLLAVMVFICLGDVQLSKTGRMRRMHQRATLALVGLSCVFYSLARKRQEPASAAAGWVRPTASGAVFLVCGLTALAGNSLLLEKWSDLEQLLLRASGPRPPRRDRSLMVGFSGQAPLGSVQLLRLSLDEDIAVRVFSDQPPGYLRGAVFERFTSRGWESHSDWVPVGRVRKPVEAAEQSSASARGRNHSQPVFPQREPSSNSLRPVKLWRSSIVDRFSFLPLNAELLEAPIDALNLDRHAVVSAENMPSEVSLTAWVAESSEVARIEPIIQPLSWEPGLPWELDRLETVTAKSRLRQLPVRLATNPKFLDIATQVFAGCKTPIEKLAAVQRHFAMSRYSTDVEIPAMVDPILYFLQERPAAHCEFFASGTAVLLRIAGIPCRYVTGYAGGEYNMLGKYWIVRQRDAHAWVEAYLPDKGWVVVDSTPAAHAPDTITSFGMWQLWDELTLRGQMIRTALAGPGWSGKWTALKLFLLSMLTTIPGALMTGGLLILALRKLRLVRSAPNSGPLEPALIELRRLLEELDRQLRRLDLERSTSETLHQFAARLGLAASSRPSLRTAADWYLRYAATRYGMSIRPELQEILQTELRAVCAVLHERRTSG